MIVDADPRQAGQSRSSKAVVIVWLRRLMVIAVLVGAGYSLVKQWPEVSHALGSLPPHLVVLSLAAAFGGVLLAPVMFHTVLAGLGTSVPIKNAAVIYLVGQLGKYLPGSVWAFLVQAELGKSAGINRSRGFITSIITFGLIIVSALLMGFLAMPTILAGHREYLWVFLPLPLGLIMLHPKPLTWIVSLGLRILRRPPLETPLRGASIAKATGIGLLTFVLFGLHLWLLASSLGSQGLSGLALCIGTISLAIAAGMLAFVLPSGIGVREVVIVAALSTVLPAGPALAVAVVSRLMFTVVDLVSAGVAALVAKLRWGVRGGV
jgi:hypothetical protein